MDARTRRPAILFAEDFDAPAGITVLDEEEEPAPLFGEAELAAARAEAYAEGHRNGLAQAAADRAEVTRQMLTAIADRLAEAREEAGWVAEESAETVARLLLGALKAMLPALTARHGEAEVAALAHALLPTLAREPQVTIRVSPHVLRAVEDEIARFDPELRARISLQASEAVAPGDARVAWQDGEAVRDAAELWQRVADTLGPLDLAPLAAVPA